MPLVSSHSQRGLDPDMVQAALSALDKKRRDAVDPIFASECLHDSVASSISASTAGEEEADFSRCSSNRVTHQLQRLMASTHSVDHVSDSEDSCLEDEFDFDVEDMMAVSERHHRVSTSTNTSGSPTSSPTKAVRRHSYASKSEEIAARIRSRHTQKTRSRSTTTTNSHAANNSSPGVVSGMDESNSTHLLLAAQGATRVGGSDGSSSTIGSSNVAGVRRPSGPAPPTLGRSQTAEDVRANKPITNSPSPSSVVPRSSKHRRHTTTSAATKPRASHLGMTKTEMKELQAMFGDRNP